ncbi:MAG TPA: ATPase, T2SS/T4P/T4SS family [Burkholderiales bacterium]|nr:ATPase, T2SS/T4P/T4SS family [Burkholderiales bacterium]
MSQQESLAWPAPPFFSYASPGDGVLPKECIVIRHDGQKLLGSLLRVLPEQTLLELQSAHRQSAALIDFGSIKSVRLTAPVRLLPRELEKMQQAEVLPAAESQTFKVNFRDGEQFKGRTRGFVMEKWGLYLYLSMEEDKVVRAFIPAQAYTDYNIGPSLGEMLSGKHRDTIDFVEVGLQFQRELRNQRIGDYLTASQIVSRDRLEQALKDRDQNKPENMLGQALLKEQLLSQQELDAAVRMQQRDRKLPLGEILVEMGAIDRATVNRLLVQKLGIPFVDPTRFDIDPAALRLVERRLAEKHRVIPLFRTGDEIVVAMENPTDPEPIHELRFYTKMRVVPVMATGEAILDAIRSRYGQQEAAQNVKELASTLAAEALVEEVKEPVVTESDNALVRLVNQIILDAHERKASDIHIETYQGHEDTEIRFREDGELVHYINIPARFRNAMISRIKIMAHLDIAERRKPQDGKIAFEKFGPAKIELRVAVMPTAGGVEDVVMRVLAAAKPIPLDKLGLRAKSLDDIKRIAERPHGLILICGPTGSGKTTTLHSVLGHLNNGKKKIWTAEDPIEITQRGLRQVQVNAKIGLTFAAAMRSFLRLDPDVIMVGEMRDAETTKTGIEASLTGHLVLSTLHTNSAAESVTRLLDLGMDPFNFADALLGVLSQRLARALCTDCKKPHKASREDIELLLKEYCEGTETDPAEVRKRWEQTHANKLGQFTLYEAVGCERCGKRGYRGRIGVHELLVNSRGIKRLIQNRANFEEIQNLALKEGMLTLKQDGIEKVLQGGTDLAQVRAIAA